MSTTRITVRNNGPLRVEGDFEIVDHEGSPFGLGGKSSIALCRCDQSGDRPFCDGSHKREGFESVCEARELPPPKS